MRGRENEALFWKSIAHYEQRREAGPRRCVRLFKDDQRTLMVMKLVLPVTGRHSAKMNGDGAKVGCAVGDAVGTGVGLALGVAVGETVGTSVVGEAVGVPDSQLSRASSAFESLADAITAAASEQDSVSTAIDCPKHRRLIGTPFDPGISWFTEADKAAAMPAQDPVTSMMLADPSALPQVMTPRA